MVLGERLAQVTAPTLVTGQALFTGDLIRPGMLVGKVLRSPVAHARIVQVDSQRAKRVPGIKAVITYQDIPTHRFGAHLHDQQLFPGDKVRYLGEPVAAVAAVDADAAEEALAMIRIEYEELPGVFDAEAALLADAPLIHERLLEYHANFAIRRYHNVCSHTTITTGDLNAAWQQCDRIWEQRFTTPMVHQAYLEPRSVLAEVDSSGQVAVWSSTQAVFLCQSQIAEALQLQLSQVRVSCTQLGGSFGGKHDILLEPHCVLLARIAGRPVKLVISREEEFLATHPRHGSVIDLKLGARRDGTILALEVRTLFDTGAYAVEGPGVASLGALYASGPYRIPHVQSEALCVYTNKVPAGAFRGYGNPQVAFAIESMLDTVAAELDQDPWELRLRHAYREGDSNLGGQVMHSVGLPDCLRQLQAEIKPELNTLQQAGDQQDRFRRGIGIACMQHYCAPLPSAAVVKLNMDGSVHLLSGATDNGAGARTVLSQIVAHELGLPLAAVGITTADTGATPYDWASCASRVTYTAGIAVQQAAQDLFRQLTSLAAEVLEVTETQLQWADGQFQVAGTGKGITMADLGRICHFRRRGPLLGSGAYLAAGAPFEAGRLKNASFEAPRPAYPAHMFGVQAVKVQVDTWTGQVKVLRLWTIQDAGKVLNPLLVEGQLEGGAVQGLGYALGEEMQFEGGHLLNPDLLHYQLPLAVDIPPIANQVIESLDSHGPYGAKGVGEPSLIPTAPAIANAIFHAVGVRICQLPLTPERVLAVMQRQKKE